MRTEVLRTTIKRDAERKLQAMLDKGESASMLVETRRRMGMRPIIYYSVRVAIREELPRETR